MHFACPGLSSWFERKFTVVLPSRALAAVAYHQFARDQLDHGHHGWQRPPILSTGAWLTACWQQARYRSPDVPTLLSATQEHLVWKRIIEADSPDLFDAAALAEMARRASRLLAEWEIVEDGVGWQNGSDAPQFQRWMNAFRRVCRQKSWMSHSDLWRTLPRWIAGGQCATERIAVPLFRASSPALNYLLNCLGDGAITQTLGPPALQGRIPATRFDSQEDEWEFAARWARQAFENNDRQSIAVFITNLTAHQGSVNRIFRDVFYPGACRALTGLPIASAPPSELAFSINADPPLASEPLVSGALQLLRIAAETISVAEAGAILRSPWIAGAANERNARAFADVELRRRRELDVTFEDIVLASRRCSQLTPTWVAVRTLLDRLQELSSFTGWSKFIGELLAAFGWPGDDDLDDREQAAIEAWKDALSQLAALSLVADGVSFEQAVAQLRTLLSAGFVSSNPWSPVQILDAAQAEGLQFDTALLTGLSNETWPPKSQGSPLVPLQLQRAHGVPGSSPPSLRAEWARKTAWLLGSSPATFATWSGRLSSLAEEFVSKNAERTGSWTGKSAWESFKPAILDETNDIQAPPFSHGETTRGGTSIIKSQSLCPFRAFAEFRLHSRSPEEGCLGLDARERGGYLHKALQLIWQILQTREKLRAMSPAKLAELVERCALEAVETDHSSSFGKIVRAVEVERLKNVILDWLEIESERQQPFTVETIEGERQFELAGLQLKLRMDRIDRLSNGKLLLIDYKSGEMTANKLQGQRPAEPQLLVYAASAESAVDGLFFGQLKAREPKMKGISRERHVAGGGNQVKKDWDRFLVDSRGEVYRLAKQFREGFAAVDPASCACDYCAQKPLCRINEQRGGQETEE